jgi:hypothetical protein
MTVNLAKPGAKALIILSALLVVAMPFIGVWMWVEEAAPVRLEIRDVDRLVARHTRDAYTIHLSELESVELIEEMPFATRTAGTAFDNLYKGRWSVRGYGAARLNLQPKNPPILVIVTAGGETYLLNDADADVTREVYTALLGALARR